MQKRKLGRSGLEVKLPRLEENLGAADLELTRDDLRAIDAAASQIQVEGARYPDELEKRTGL